MKHVDKIYLSVYQSYHGSLVDNTPLPPFLYIKSLNFKIIVSN